FFTLLLEEVYDAFELCIPICSRILDGRNCDGNLIAVQEHIQDFFRNILDGGAQCAFIPFENGFYFFEDPNIAVLTKRQDPTTADAEFLIWYHRLLGYFFGLSQSVTNRTGPVRRVEGECIRRGLIIGKT